VLIINWLCHHYMRVVHIFLAAAFCSHPPLHSWEICRPHLPLVLMDKTAGTFIGTMNTQVLSLLVVCGKLTLIPVMVRHWHPAIEPVPQLQCIVCIPSAEPTVGM
jgi:hypothetical protein